jgi:hypothetical protein
MGLNGRASEDIDRVHDTGQVAMAACCGHGNEGPCGSIRSGVFLDQISDCLLIKKGSVPWSLFSYTKQENVCTYDLSIV